MQCNVQGSRTGWGWLDAPGALHVEKGEHRRTNDVYLVLYGLLLLLALHASYSWSVRSDDGCIARENKCCRCRDFDLLLGPNQTHTVTLLA